MIGLSYIQVLYRIKWNSTYLDIVNQQILEVNLKFMYSSGGLFKQFLLASLRKCSTDGEGFG